ncbi:hypothetical protein O5542_11210 [Escherichia coli]|nr:hypothetical protein [Escherichia coli]MCZ5566541.1 hypothetical protein [Escherichia coli]MCZ5831575.1 hypothetical protein [Escherichia coli]
MVCKKPLIYQDDQPFLPVRPPQYRNAKAFEAKSTYTWTAPSSSLNGNSLHRLNGLSLPEFSWPTYTLLITSAFLHDGLRPALPKALLPRDRHPAPEC